MRKAIKLILIGACATTLLAREQYTREFQKTAPLASGRSLRIEHSNGGVNTERSTVETGPVGPGELVVKHWFKGTGFVGSHGDDGLVMQNHSEWIWYCWKPVAKYAV